MIAVALKPVQLDALPGTAEVCRLSYSAADQAALSLALDFGRRLGAPVHVASAGPTGSTTLLEGAIRVGAAEATWFPADQFASSEAVARRLSDAFGSAMFVICGDYSNDRGSGSVPAFLAAELGIAQALGLAQAMVGPMGLEVARRLDGGGLERLIVAGRCVVSVDPSVARPVRASLSAMLSPLATTVKIGVPVDDGPKETVVRRPHRPRSRDLAIPRGDFKERLDAILGFDAASTRQREVVALPPEEAATRIIRWMRDRGRRLHKA